MIKKIKIFGKEIIINLYVGMRDIKTKVIYGYTNRCIDGKYIITLDYDSPYDEFYMHELSKLQDKYKISDFYILLSNKGFHAVCLSKVPKTIFKKILDDSSCDINYKKVPFMFGKKLWTLRYSEKKGKKPFYYACLNSNHKFKYVNSLPHITAMNMLFNINIKPINHDKQSKLIMARYTI